MSTEGQERPLKIAVAANQIGVSVKTIYNWIEHGYLETAEPGYVRQLDVAKAKDRAEKSKSTASKSTIRLIPRDEKGRFIILKTDK